MSRVTSIRLSDELAGRLDELAVAVDRSKAWLIEQAIARYVEEEAWQVVAVTEALAEYRAGGATLHDHDDVMGRLEARIRATAGDADPLA
jgi:predicted transcriptional regulator